MSPERFVSLPYASVIDSSLSLGRPRPDCIRQVGVFRPRCTHPTAGTRSVRSNAHLQCRIAPFEYHEVVIFPPNGRKRPHVTEFFYRLVILTIRGTEFIGCAFSSGCCTVIRVADSKSLFRLIFRAIFVGLFSGFSLSKCVKLYMARLQKNQLL